MTLKLTRENAKYSRMPETAALTANLSRVRIDREL